MEPKGIKVTPTNHRTDTKFLLHSSSNQPEIFYNICMDFWDKVFQSPLYHVWKCFSLANLNVIKLSFQRRVSLKCS